MMLTFCRYFFLLPALFRAVYGSQQFFNGFKGKYDAKYGYFSESQRLYYKEEARKMFYFGYDNYMKYAFPQDELNPVFCSGRGPDHENPSNININDVLGDYALTLVDCLDTLAVMGNASEFKRAVQLVIEQVSFDKPSTVQVFEATIRIIGSLLSAHLIIKDKKQPFGEVAPPGYDDQLLRQAHELASRLMPAFENTATGIPYPRVHLQEGVPRDCINETCIAGAGTLLLEFGILSHLLNDPVYQSVARRAINAMWSYRSNVTGLLGNIINIQTGAWEGRMSGLGAGLDSFYEYLLKSYILFGDMESLKKFNESYEIIKYYMRKGRKHCNSGDGFPPLYVNVNMKDGETANNWIDSLQASWAAVQVLYGDIDEAICSHAIYHAIWRRYGALPERYNYQLKAPDVSFYPLRPELVESTYVLYQATKNPFYLHVGKDILESLNKHAKAKCGYATIHDVTKKDHEDRMESFFLSETCKYLYLLFDVDNHVNKESSNYIFTTEGHLIPVQYQGFQKHRSSNFKSTRRKDSDIVEVDAQHSNITKNCNNIGDGVKYFLPLKSRYFEQMDSMIGLG